MKIRTSLVASIFFLVTLVAPTEALAVVQSLNSQSGQNQTFQNDSNVTISSSNNIHSIIWQGLLPISRGGTGASSFTNGSIPFIFNGIFSQDNPNFFWDNINKRLGIGTSSPTSALDVSSDATINSLTVGLGGGSVTTNTAIGKSALLNNTTGIRNTAIGYDTLYHATSSQNNVALGFRALHEITTGSENVAIGYNSLFQNVSGGGNVVIGANAGWQQADGSYLTSVTDNIYIGGDVRGNNNDDNSIVIGNSTTVGAGSNTAVIGNSSVTDVYFGSSAGLAKIHATNIATVSSGTSAPTFAPTALGQIYIDTSAAKVYISTGTSSSTDWALVN